MAFVIDVSVSATAIQTTAQQKAQQTKLPGLGIHLRMVLAGLVDLGVDCFVDDPSERTCRPCLNPSAPQTQKPRLFKRGFARCARHRTDFGVGRR